VLGKSPISGGHVSAPPVPASVVAHIRRLAQVADAQGFIDDRAEIRDAKGRRDHGSRSPSGLRGASPRRRIQHCDHGRRSPPERARPGCARPADSDAQHFKLGSTIGIVTRHPLQFFHVVGIVRFGGVQSLGPMQIVVLDLPVAQQLFDKQGHDDEIFVSARTGVSPVQLVRAIAPLLPASAGQDRRRAGALVHQQRKHPVRPVALRAARVRRDRTVRRLVRDLQHAVDHGRAAPLARCGDSVREEIAGRMLS